MSKESAMAMATGAPAPAAPAPQGAEASAPAPQAQPAPNQIDPRTQALLKKETALVREREQLGREKAEWADKVKQAETILSKGKQFDELMAKKDAIAALKLIGFDDTQIFNIMAEGGKEKPQKTPEEIARETTQQLLKEEQDKRQKEQEEAQTRANNEAVTTSIRNLVSNPENAEKFEYCAFHGEIAQELIRETLFEFAKQDKANAEAEGKTYVVDEQMANQLLAEAAEKVEEYYEGLDRQMNEKIKKRKKLFGETTQEATAAVIQEEQQKAETAPAPKAPAPKTPPVTNRIAATAAAAAGQRETQAQKRARLERVLATGDRTLLRSN